MRNLIFLACLLIAQCSYSQTTYPKQTVLNGDTLVLVTLEQVKLINYTFLSLEECKALGKSYVKQIENYKFKCGKQEALISNLRSQINTSTDLQREQEESIKLLEENTSKLERKLRLSKATRVIYTSVGILGGGYLGYTIGKLGVIIL